MRIGVLGATGPAGSALVARLAAVGFDVVVGSRSAERAEEVRDGIVAKWPDHELRVDAAVNDGAAEADVVVIATPWDAAPSTAESVASRLSGKVVISMANCLVKVGREFQPLVPPRGSVALGVQAMAPGAMVATAFHHVPAKELGHITEPVESDVLVCSDHPAAIETTSSVVSKIPGLRPLNAGSLSNAAPIESFVAVLLQLNVRYKTRVGVRLTGIPD